jgi:hypothetical protein
MSSCLFIVYSSAKSEWRRPRATLFTPADAQEWASALGPPYQRRLREVNEAIVGAYLAGGNTRRSPRSPGAAAQGGQKTASLGLE